MVGMLIVVGTCLGASVTSHGQQGLALALGRKKRMKIFKRVTTLFRKSSSTIRKFEFTNAEMVTALERISSLIKLNAAAKSDSKLTSPKERKSTLCAPPFGNGAWVYGGTLPLVAAIAVGVPIIITLSLAVLVSTQLQICCEFNMKVRLEWNKQQQPTLSPGYIGRGTQRGECSSLPALKSSNALLMHCLPESMAARLKSPPRLCAAAALQREESAVSNNSTPPGVYENMQAGRQAGRKAGSFWLECNAVTQSEAWQRNQFREKTDPLECLVLLFLHLLRDKLCAYATPHRAAAQLRPVAPMEPPKIKVRPRPEHAATCAVITFGPHVGQAGLNPESATCTQEEARHRTDPQHFGHGRRAPRPVLAHDAPTAWAPRASDGGHAHDTPACPDLLSAIDQIKPTALIGVCTIAKAFSEEVCQKMCVINKRPIIFALSNPTSKAECTAEEAYTFTDG
ncbi:hypothetical protein ON010_g8990 [Phytophthora cinnamomi]|nr:hypothetical protein ON010_g8990 [Phytophthora cinnamomi]